jgi:hypothetical protein
MGTDSFVTAQKRVNGEWVEVKTDFLDDRIYAAFGWLANVRNYAAVPTFHPDRGIPEDAGEEVKEHHAYFYGKTWYSVEELTSFDYDQPVENRRVSRRTALNVLDGGCTCAPGEGKMTTYRELFGTYFMEGLQRLAESGAERVILSFD